MQNAHIPYVKNGNLGISSIISMMILSEMTLSSGVKMWYVMHGAIWVYCAHGAHRFSGSCLGSFWAGNRRVLHRPVCLRRRIFACSSGGGGGDPVGVPQPNRKTNKIQRSCDHVFPQKARYCHASGRWPGQPPVCPDPEDRQATWRRRTAIYHPTTTNTPSPRR